MSEFSSGNFQGWLLKFGTQEFPHEFIKRATWKSTPNQRLENDPWTDMKGYLHRDTLPHYRTKIEFETVDDLTLEEKIKIQEVIVVEGKDDTANLRRFYEVDTYETRGSAINEDDLERIDKLNDLRGVIVFTDPDYNGERIRKIIMEAIPTAKHAFLNRGEATPKSKTKGRSLGVEHASFEDLQKALSGVLGSYDDDNQFDISKSNLMKLGLLMGADSRKRREYLGEALRIGYCNGKQLLKRLELFGITLEELEEAMSNY